MFKRRAPLTISRRVKEFFWPSMGWRRVMSYFKLRILRIADTPHKVAAGLAIGAAISFTPLIGTHILQAMLLAFIFRVNIVAAVIGTIVGNPSTFPLMWLMAIELGVLIFEFVGLPASSTVPHVNDFSAFWAVVLGDPLRVFMPWLVGGYLLTLLSLPIFYYIFYSVLKGTKTARQGFKGKRIERAVDKANKEDEVE